MQLLSILSDIKEYIRKALMMWWLHTLYKIYLFWGRGGAWGLVVVGGWEWNCKDKDALPSTAHKCFIFIMFFTFFVQTNQVCCKFWFVFAFLHFRIYDLWLIFSINVFFAAITKPKPLSSLQMSKSVIQSHIRTLFSNTVNSRCQIKCKMILLSVMMMSLSPWNREPRLLSVVAVYYISIWLLLEDQMDHRFSERGPKNSKKWVLGGE